MRLARDLLDSNAGELLDAARLDALHRQIDQTAAALDHLVTTAPNNDARSATSAAEQALLGAMSALDAEQLLRTGPSPASEAALDDAAATRTSHAHALDDALTQLDALAIPPTLTGAPATHQAQAEHPDPRAQVGWRARFFLAVRCSIRQVARRGRARR